MESVSRSSRKLTTQTIDQRRHSTITRTYTESYVKHLFTGLEFDGGTAAIFRRALATGRNAVRMKQWSSASLAVPCFTYKSRRTDALPFSDDEMTPCHILLSPTRVRGKFTGPEIAPR